MVDPFEHLNALRLGLSRERDRLNKAKKPSEIAMRKVWVERCEREIEGEIAFLAKRGIVEPALEGMTDEDLLAELGA